MWERERERASNRTYRDASSVHAHRQPPGLRVKGHAGAGVWREREKNLFGFLQMSRSHMMRLQINGVFFILLSCQLFSSIGFDEFGL